MIMASPVPFDVANINNSPLAADGSDFPCKVNSGMSAYSYTVTAMNEIPVDKPILLSFDGSAIHGGGTCQLSITFDAQPTKESVFKVIQTFEGGECPKPTGSGLTFNIPKEFPNVENATLAWTWFNRVGNREMYMNCAPISITGGSDSKDYYGTLPDMLVANVPATDCRTEDSKDAQPPNPGTFVLQSTDLNLAILSGAKCPAEVQTNNAKSGTVTNLASFDPPATDYNKIVPVAGGGGGTSGAPPSVPVVGGGGNDGMYTPPANTPSQPSPTAATPNNGLYSQPAASAAPSSAPSSAFSSSSSAAVSAPAPTASAPAASHSTFQTFTIPASSAAPSSVAPPAYPTLSPSMGQGVSGPSSGASAASPTGSSSSSSSPSTGSAGSSTTCSTEGAVVCNGTDQFGLCNHGNVVWQKVASGTTCSNGSIQKRSSGHVRRHAHGAFKVRSS
jgi:hypothetical protein